MVLREKTNNNSDRYVPKTEETRENKPKTRKSGSLPRKLNKNISQNNKKFLKTNSAQGYLYLKRMFELLLLIE